MELSGSNVPLQLDEIALAALQARSENVERAQVSKLIEYLEATDSFTLVMYLTRQVARGFWGSGGRSLSAARLFKVIKIVLDNVQDESKRKEVLRKVLGYFKWFYEIADRAYAGRESRESIQKLIQKYPSVFNNPGANAPQGFATELISAYLRI